MALLPVDVASVHGMDCDKRMATRTWLRGAYADIFGSGYLLFVWYGRRSAPAPLRRRARVGSQHGCSVWFWGAACFKAAAVPRALAVDVCSSYRQPLTVSG